VTNSDTMVAGKFPHSHNIVYWHSATFYIDKLLNLPCNHDKNQRNNPLKIAVGPSISDHSRHRNVLEHYIFIQIYIFSIVLCSLLLKKHVGR